MKSSTIISLILATLMSLELYARPSDMTCSMVYTSDIPMMVTDATDMGKKDYENFREKIIPKEDNVSHFITKRSIVRVLGPAPRGQSFLNIEVLAEAKINEARAQGHFDENAHNKMLPQAKKGQKGFIHRDSLKPSDDFVFVVAKDSAFIALPAPYDTAKAFRISMSGKDYKVNRCCVEVQAGQTEKSCFDYPVFEARLEGSWSAIEDEMINAKVYCGVSTDTRPIEKNQYKAITDILKYPSLGLEAGFLPDNRSEANANDLYYVDSRGLVMLPHVIADKGVDLTQGPFGSYHYTGGGQDIKGDDAYLAPYAACGFMAVMREWNRRYPECSGKGCGIAWGNCSHSSHVAGVRGRWPSKTHGHGHCIDIRLFTKTNQTVSSNVYSNAYNRNRTVEFLQLARAAGATTIYLQDAKAARMVHKQKGRGFAQVLTKVPPHKDHMHVCFSHRSTEGRSSFADPLAPATNFRLKNACSQDSSEAVAGMPSSLLSTTIVATAGIKTPYISLPLVGPIPRPRPRPEDLIVKKEGIEVYELPPIVPEVSSDSEIKIVQLPVPTPIKPVRIIETGPVITETQTTEVTVPEVEKPVEAVVSTSGSITPTEVEPIIVSVPAAVPEQAQTEDPFTEKIEDLSIDELMKEDIRQEELSNLEKEKYYGDKLNEIEVDETKDHVVEGDYIEGPTQEMPEIIEQPIDQEEDRASLTLSSEPASPPSSVNSYAREEPRTSDAFSSKPNYRPTGGRVPTAQSVDQRDELEQAVDGAYQPVTTPEDNSPGFFASFFSGIWQFLAGIFSFLG